MSKVRIDCNIVIVGNTIEEAMERLKMELEGVTQAVTEPGDDIVDGYHYWNVENEGDVDWCAHDHRAGKPDDWYASSAIHIQNVRDGLLSRP